MVVPLIRCNGLAREGADWDSTAGKRRTGRSSGRMPADTVHEASVATTTCTRVKPARREGGSSFRAPLKRAAGGVTQLVS